MTLMITQGAKSGMGLTGMSLSIVLGIPATATLRPRFFTSCHIEPLEFADTFYRLVCSYLKHALYILDHYLVYDRSSFLSSISSNYIDLQWEFKMMNFCTVP